MLAENNYNTILCVGCTLFFPVSIIVADRWPQLAEQHVDGIISTHLYQKTVIALLWLICRNRMGMGWVMMDRLSLGLTYNLGVSVTSKKIFFKKQQGLHHQSVQLYAYSEVFFQ